MNNRSAFLAAVAGVWASGALAAEAEVINPESYFPEGPLWHDGQLYYVEYAKHRVMRWDGETNAEVWMQDGCGPSAVIAARGNFLVTCYDTNELVEISPEWETLAGFAEDEAGAPLVGPNDAVADAEGGVYFSASGIWDIAAPIAGRIFYMAPNDTITEVADDIHYANGVALSPGGGTLYVSEMGAQRVLEFAVEDGGELGDRYLFARLEDIAPNPEGVDIYMGPDGLATDDAGNLYIAQFEGSRVLVADPKAQPVRILEVPLPYVTNLAFGKTEDVVFVTAASNAWQAPWPGKVFRVTNR